MNERVDDGLATGLTGVCGNFLAAVAAFFELAGDGCVSLDEGKGLLNQSRFDDLASIVSKRRHRAAQSAPLTGCILLVHPGKSNSVDTSLWQESIGSSSEQKNACNGDAVFDHDLRVEQKSVPSSFIIVIRHVLLSDVHEIILETPHIQVGEGGTGYRAQFGAEAPTLLKKAPQLLRSRLAALGSDPDEVGIFIVVPKGMDIETTRKPHAGNVFAWLDILDQRMEWNEARPYLVTAGRHDPFFEFLPCNAADAAIIFNPQQYDPAFQVGEGDKFLCQVVVLNIIALEFDAGIFAIADHFKQFGAGYGHV